MKKSTTILTIVSMLLTIIAAALLVFSPMMFGGAGYMSGVTDVMGALKLIGEKFVSQNLLLFKTEFYSQTATNGFPILYLLPVLLGLLAIFWLVHLVVLIAKKRPGALFVNLFSLIFGILSYEIISIFLAPGWFKDDENAIAVILGSGTSLNLGMQILAILPYAIACFSFALTVITLLVSAIGLSRKPVVEEAPQEETTEEDEDNSEEEEEPKEVIEESVSEPETETAIESEPISAPAPAAPVPAPAAPEKEEEKPATATQAAPAPTDYAGVKPAFIQYIYNTGSGDDTKSKKDREEFMTKDDVRAIIREELSSNKGEEVEKEQKDANVPASDESEALTSDDLRKIIAEELEKSKDNDIPVDVVDDEKENDDLSSNETAETLTSDDLRKIVSEEIAKAIAPEKAEEKKTDEDIQDEPVATIDDLRTIIREELNTQKENTAPEVKEDNEEEKPLTASDLRSLIQEALDEHDNPERRELTEEEARELINQQIRSYYIGKREDLKRDSEAIKAQKEAEEKAKIEEEKRLALEKALKEDAMARVKEREERALDRQERLEAEKKRESLSLEDIRNIVRDELNNIKPASTGVDEASKDDIKSLIQSELSAFRDEQAKASEKAAQEAADAHLIEQARAEAEAEETKSQSEQIKAQSEEIKNMKENAITPDAVRDIISEELDKRFAELLKAQKEAAKKDDATSATIEKKKEEVEPETKPTQTIVIQVAAPEGKAQEKKEEVVPEPAPTSNLEDGAEAESEDVSVAAAIGDAPKAKIIRIPFNERMLVADKETQDNYNELKAECLSYGLKSRLSNSGDTFRLHTKTYVKITIAGKGLKLYFALDPKEYENSPIPLHDAGNKNIYKEIPGVFKVKSALSLRRAKQLLADACEKDNLEQGKIVPHDYAAELKDYVPQLGGKKDDKDED